MFFEELPSVDHSTCFRIIEGSIERGVQFGPLLGAQVVAIDDSNVDLGPFG
jgi:hypothetical protein